MRRWDGSEDTLAVFIPGRMILVGNSTSNRDSIIFFWLLITLIISILNGAVCHDNPVLYLPVRGTSRY